MFHADVLVKVLQIGNTGWNQTCKKFFNPSDLPITTRPLSPFTSSASKHLGSGSESCMILMPSFFNVVHFQIKLHYQPVMFGSTKMDKAKLMMKIGSKKWQNLIFEGAKNLDIQAGPESIEKFAAHALELMKWNPKINLTAITDPLEVAIKHFLDSIIPAKIIPPNTSLLDIGSGAGFPGIPLKILIPSLSVTLIDASRKKVSFLNHVIRTLELEGIEALHVRAENFAKKTGITNTYDVIISRALSSMAAFAMTALCFLKKGGVIIAMRGKVSDEDMAVLRSTIHKKLGIPHEDTHAVSLRVDKYTLPYLESDRAIVSMKIFI